MRRSRLFLFLLLVAASACSSAEDRAAKKRIFSPEDPPKVLQAAQEVLQPEALGERPAMAARILSISAREAAFRIGPHRQEVEAGFRWEREGRTVSLKEKRVVEVEPGGDFHVLVENDALQGMEWIRIEGTSYARSRFDDFRERRRDRGSSEHVLEEAYRTLPSFLHLLQGAVKFTRAGTEEIEGREAFRYQVALGEVRKSEDSTLPPIAYPEGGPDEDTALRLRALEKGEPKAVSGSLWVDRGSGVPLRAELEATVQVPDEDASAELSFSIRLTTSKIGGPLGIQVPDHLEDAPRPPGPVATLEAYGFQRLADAVETEEAEPGEQ